MMFVLSNPFRSVKRSSWINKEMRNQMANRDNAVTTAKRTGDPDDLVYGVCGSGKSRRFGHRATS